MSRPKIEMCRKCESIVVGGGACNCPPAPVHPDVEGLLRLLEDEAGRYGSSAGQPLGVLMGPPGDERPHTRTNRVKLTFLSCGLNRAAEIVREWAKPKVSP